MKAKCHILEMFDVKVKLWQCNAELGLVIMKFSEKDMPVMISVSAEVHK